MNADGDLLFGVLALQLELVDPQRLVEACRDRCGEPLADHLLMKGLIDDRGRAEVDRLMERKLRSRGDDASRLLAEFDEATKRALADALVGEAVAATQGSPDAYHPFASTLSFQHTPSVGFELDLPEGCSCGGGADRYRLIRLHARGGIGRIWLARDTLLGRDVARKELRPEKEVSRTARARLLEEARITGQLQHPGVVPVYELVRGNRDDPAFYTMRYVKGRTLSEAARDYHRKREKGEAGPLDLHELLDAFVAVCNTVAYAHSRGVIHRDLKGPNVVLGNFGEVVLLDWGLAKLVDDPDREGESSPVILDPPESRDETLAGKALGTPAYIPPEQAAGRLDLIDRRSDVYGLGAILYEILTGQPPFDLPGSDPEGLLRLARDERPRPPRQVCRSVPAPLESICLKALERNQADRYQSAAELAKEVRRYLADEPVQAHRDSIAARLGRLARRHRTAVAVSAVLLLAASAGLAARDVYAEREHRQTYNHLRRMLGTVDTMLVEVGRDELNNVPGMQPVQRQVLEKAAETYRELLRDYPSDPDVRRGAGRALRKLGEIDRLLGRFDEARAELREAIGLTRGLEGGDPNGPIDSAHALLELAWLEQWAGHLDASERAYREALALPILSRPAPIDPRRTLAQIRGLDDYATLLLTVGRAGEAEPLARQALGLASRLPPGSPALRFRTARGLNVLAGALRLTGRVNEAERSYREAAKILEGLLLIEPRDTDCLAQLGQARAGLGKLILDREGDPAEAEAEFRRSLEAYRRLARDFPDITNYASQAANARNSVGSVLLLRGQASEAEETLTRAVADYRELADRHPEVAAYQSGLGNALGNLGELEMNRSRPERARELLSESIGRFEAALGISPDDAEARRSMQTSRERLGRLTGLARRDDRDSED